MRFDGLDLNLLVAFQVLMEERNVSAAARRLNLTQPAVSGALSRLRDYFKDDLLALQGRKMHPTPKAEGLFEPVSRALLQIRGEITRAGNFDPRISTRHFQIIASDYAFTIGLSDMFVRAESVAPMVTFELIPPSSMALERFERAEIDLAITVRPFENQRYPLRELWKDTDVIISWAGADYTQITEDIFYDAGHAIATFGPDRRPSVTDLHIAKLERPRRIEITLPNFGDLCRGVVGTRRLATMHRRYAEYFASMFPINIHDMWTPLPEIVQIAQWHKVRNTDPGVQWILDMLAE